MLNRCVIAGVIIAILAIISLAFACGHRSRPDADPKRLTQVESY